MRLSNDTKAKITWTLLLVGFVFYALITVEGGDNWKNYNAWIRLIQNSSEWRSAGTPKNIVHMFLERARTEQIMVTVTEGVTGLETLIEFIWIPFGDGCPPIWPPELSRFSKIHKVALSKIGNTILTAVGEFLTGWNSKSMGKYNFTTDTTTGQVTVWLSEANRQHYDKDKKYRRWVDLYHERANHSIKSLSTEYHHRLLEFEESIVKSATALNIGESYTWTGNSWRVLKKTVMIPSVIFDWSNNDTKIVTLDDVLQGRGKCSDIKVVISDCLGEWTSELVTEELQNQCRLLSASEEVAGLLETNEEPSAQSEYDDMTEKPKVYAITSWVELVVVVVWYVALRLVWPTSSESDSGESEEL